MKKSKAKGLSKFEKWFCEQFGNRVSDKPIESLEENMVKAHQVYVRDKVTYEKCLMWDEKFNDCLYAWNAKAAKKVRKK